MNIMNEFFLYSFWSEVLKEGLWCHGDTDKFVWNKYACERQCRKMQGAGFKAQIDTEWVTYYLKTTS